MHKILVAIDGSDHSERALDLASRIGKKFDSELTIVHVVYPGPLTEEEIQLAEAEYAAEVDRYLRTKEAEDNDVSKQSSLKFPSLRHHQELAGKIHGLVGDQMVSTAKAQCKEHGVDRINTIVRPGDPVDTVINVAKETEADLIVLGSRGRSPLQSVFLGSVSSKVNSLSSVPVLTVK